MWEFHGAPVGFACESWPSHARTWSDRRTAHRPNARSHPLARLPPFLAEDAGVTPHDDRPLHAGGHGRREPPPCVPASVDSLPTSAMQEDHVSRGWGAAASCGRRWPTLPDHRCDWICAARVSISSSGAARLRQRLPPSPRCAKGVFRYRARPLAVAGTGSGRGVGDERRCAVAVERVTARWTERTRRDGGKRQCQDHDPCGHREDRC